MSWPAIYVYAEFLDYWFLIIPAIILEALLLKAFFRFSFPKSFGISVVGNIISVFLGMFAFMWAMIPWHFFADDLVENRTFGVVNWVATYIIMCLSSVLVETFALKQMFKQPFKKLFLPLLTGNLLIYLFIANTMGMNIERHKNKPRSTVKISYQPVESMYTLLDSTQLTITGAHTTVYFNNDDEVLNESFPLEIRFTSENYREFPCRFRLPEEESKPGLEKRKNILQLTELSDTLNIILEQKNPVPDSAWISPVIIDTIVFVRHRNADW